MNYHQEEKILLLLLISLPYLQAYLKVNYSDIKKVPLRVLMKTKRGILNQRTEEQYFLMKSVSCHFHSRVNCYEPSSTMRFTKSEIQNQLISISESFLRLIKTFLMRFITK